MAVEIKMPQLSDTMNSGKILGWKKKEGDKIERGDILAEVETEKANLEIESFSQGVLLKITIPAGTVAKVGDVIAVIGSAGEQYAPSTAAAPAPAAAKPQVAPSAQPAPTSQGSPTPTLQAAPAHSFSGGERVKASPLAKKIAAERNINLTAVRGSGPLGRIVKKDLEGAPLAVASQAAPVLSQVAPQPTSRAGSQPQNATTLSGGTVSGGKSYPLSKMRELIARRMQESVTQSPHFYVTTAVNMGEAKRFYQALKERPDFKGISLNHLIIKAAAYGIAKEPTVNRAIRDGMVYEPDGINIGIITAVEDGLLIPVIRDANLLSLKDLAFEARAAIERAKAGRPTASDLSGGTFSISNMGMFDVENFTAIINPGQGSVLAISSTREEPIVQQGQIVPGSIMKATISVDHRVIDGVMAATSLKYFKEALELPALLVI